MKVPCLWLLMMFALYLGTPEIAGLTTIQALEIIRGCRGLNIVGCDLVEVSSRTKFCRSLIK